MTRRSPKAPAEEDPVTTVACPQCDHPVAVSVPDREVEVAVRPYVAAFGDHSVVRCPSEHRFWVYYSSHCKSMHT